MPLIKGKSEKAFKKNIETEMHHGKPQKQALAIAYSMKRRAKKMADGGMPTASSDMPEENPNRAKRLDTKMDSPSDIPADSPLRIKTKMADGGAISAKTEKRPMPEDLHNDEMDAHQNSARKPLKDAYWTDNPTVRQAQNKPKVEPIKHPKMVPTDAFSTRLYDKEGKLQESASPGPYGEQPESYMNEEDPKKRGSDPDMSETHSTHRKPYAKGGQIEPKDHESHNIDMRTRMEPKDDPESMHERREQLNHMREDSPSMDEGYEHAMEHNEEDPMSHGPDPDMADSHVTGRKPYAKGGTIQYEDAMDNIDHDMEFNPAYDKYSPVDSMEQPEEEEHEEHHNSIAAAIMAKRRGIKQISDSDEDRMIMMADGGILSHDSIYSDDSDMVDLSRNHDEDANEEDQLSFNALRKENYNSDFLKMDQPDDSNLKSDDEEMDSHDRHDMISAIRSKMKRNKQF